MQTSDIHEPSTDLPDVPPPSLGETEPSDTEIEPSESEPTDAESLRAEESVQIACGCDEPSGTPPAAVDPSLVTDVTCSQCGSKASWKGALDPTAAAWSRGIDDASGLPNCPHCGTPTTIAEQKPIADAITEAAAHLESDQVATPRQPAIPGLHPPFDFASAMASIEEQESEASQAERTYARKAADAKTARKAADDENAKLRKLIQEFRQRRLDDAETAARETPRHVPKRCTYEATTGNPCPVCRSGAGATVTDGASLEHLARVTASSVKDTRADGLQAAIEGITGITLMVETVKHWTAKERASIGKWLTWWADELAAGKNPRSGPMPAAMGRPHEIGEAGKACRLCGASVPTFARADNADGWPAGQLVGVDCAGAPEAEPARTLPKRHASSKARTEAKQRASREAKAIPAKKATAAKKKPARRSLRG